MYTEIMYDSVPISIRKQINALFAPFSYILITSTTLDNVLTSYDGYGMSKRRVTAVLKLCHVYNSDIGSVLDSVLIVILPFVN